MCRGRFCPKAVALVVMNARGATSAPWFSRAARSGWRLHYVAATVPRQSLLFTGRLERNGKPARPASSESSDTKPPTPRSVSACRLTRGADPHSAYLIAPEHRRAEFPSTTYRFGKGIGDGNDSRSRWPDELFVPARVVCSRLSTSTSALLMGAICSFSTSDEAIFSTGATSEPSGLVGRTCSSVGSAKSWLKASPAHAVAI